MYPYFFLNLAIIALVCFGVAWTTNPLFILGLALLRDMPVFPPKYMVDAEQNEESEPDESKPMGFTADIK